MTRFIEEPEHNTLKIERTLAAPRAAVWRCWTEPDLLKQWFCPKPWSVAVADLDVRPGGRMNTVMQGPNGERIENAGIWLEVVDGARLAFTDAYREGFVPCETSFMTGFVELTDAPAGGTHMVWGARHANAEDARKHLAMGFEDGWTAASAQLEDLARTVAAAAPSAGAPATFTAKARTCLFLKSEAEAAARFYVSLLPDSAIDAVYRPDPNGMPLVVEFTLAGLPCMILNGNPDPQSSFMMSLSILAADQDETDRLWAALIADGGEEGRCGWLKDRFGVHWQIVPEALPRLMSRGDPAAAARVSDALMKMGKIDVAAIEAAFGVASGAD